MCQHITGRYDFVGSFLRPEALVKAREDFKSGAITEKDLKVVEDQTITDLIAKQKELGYEFITDGEFRRSSWHLDFMWGFQGIDHHETKTGLSFAGEVALLDDTYLVDKLSFNEEHPFFDHFQFVQQFEEPGHIAKLTIPAPAQFLEQLIAPYFSTSAVENTKKFYGNLDDLVEDLANVYRQFIAKAYDLGLRHLQIDDCSWGLLVDPHAEEAFGTNEDGIEKIKQLFLDVNNRAIVNRPDDLVVNTHVCRGNFKSTYAATGSYEDVAEFLFAREEVDGYFLEFDDERSGGFEPLRKVSGDKRVVLGLITTKKPELEDKEQIIARIHQAAEYVPLERLALSPQCGFASTEHGNKLTAEDQWKKLQLVKDIAEEVWG